MRNGTEKGFFIIYFYFQDVTKNENWNKCLDTNGQRLGRCIYDCKDDEWCEADCVWEFKVETDDCPCEVRCIREIPESRIPP